MDDTFWELLTTLEFLLDPYCYVLNILQTDKARLHEVLHCFAYLYQFWKEFPDDDMADEILLRLQKRWEIYLHMGKWLVYYYKAWTGHNPESILTEFDDFSQGIKYPFDEASVAQFKGNIHKYWCWVRDAYPEIGTVTAHIFGICVNVASVERLWSSMGFFHIKNRNRLKFTRVLEMAKLRANINYNRRNDQQESANNTMTENKNKNKNDNENEIGDENENERYLQNEELNDNDLNNNQGSIDLKENLNSQFNNHLNEWLEELQQEEDDEYDGEHDEYSESEKDFSDINVEDIEHPAENIDAKWKLEFMFEDNLCNPFNV
ncbi:ribonuclease H-like domain-containing protein [Rhizophagus irregularis DAOM 181602=DAOM 197198]|nr:ribonuclease H-like domain-containing protein [Rhizophagus irregularis DAOM 181602=DAOM 197198]